MCLPSYCPLCYSSVLKLSELSPKFNMLVKILETVIASSFNSQENCACFTPVYAFTALEQVLFLGFCVYLLGIPVQCICC